MQSYPGKKKNKTKSTKINLPCFLAILQLLRGGPGAQRGNTKEALVEGSTACGKLDCDFIVWRLRQAGVCFSREQTPENTQGCG